MLAMNGVERKCNLTLWPYMEMLWIFTPQRGWMVLLQTPSRWILTGLYFGDINCNFKTSLPYKNCRFYGVFHRNLMLCERRIINHWTNFLRHFGIGVWHGIYIYEVSEGLYEKDALSWQINCLSFWKIGLGEDFSIKVAALRGPLSSFCCWCGKTNVNIF